MENSAADLLEVKRRAWRTMLVVFMVTNGDLWRFFRTLDYQITIAFPSAKDRRGTMFGPILGV